MNNQENTLYWEQKKQQYVRLLMLTTCDWIKGMMNNYIYECNHELEKLRIERSRMRLDARLAQARLDEEDRIERSRTRLDARLAQARLDEENRAEKRELESLLVLVQRAARQECEAQRKRVLQRAKGSFWPF
jgi:ABC-type phosphate transport system auxiliary subunit